MKRTALLPLKQRVLKFLYPLISKIAQTDDGHFVCLANELIPNNGSCTEIKLNSSCRGEVSPVYFEI